MQLDSTELLLYPDFWRPSILQTDASDFALGYILAQEESGDLMPIPYGGCLLSPAKIRYAPTERELLANFCLAKREEVYLKGNDFIVYIDHEPLTCLQTAINYHQ